MKRTLRRESKALEIAGREALGARRFGPAGMSGGAGGRPRLPRERVKAPRDGCRRLPAPPRPSRRDGQRRLRRRQGDGDRAGREGGLASLPRCGPPRRPPPMGPRSKKTRASFGRQGDGVPVAFGADGGRESGARSSGDTLGVVFPSRGQGRRHGGPERPVLKHGPRSLTRARAGGPQEPRMRSESEGCPCGIRGGKASPSRRARTIGRPGFSRKVRAGAHPSGPERSRTMGDQDEARGNSGGGPKRY